MDLIVNFAKSEPGWIQIVSALGVPLALAIAIGNALWQSHLQRRQLRVTLFDKRFSVYVTLRQFLVESKKTVDECTAFLQQTREGKFLFGQAFDDFVNEVYKKANRLRSLNELLKDGQRPNQRYLDELQCMDKWWMDAFVAVEKRFGPYLKLSNK